MGQPGQYGARGISHNCNAVLAGHNSLHSAFGKFYDIPCSTSSYQSICETDFNYSICPPQKCPLDDPGYFLVQGKCFYLEKDSKDFKDAKANCKYKGGKLYEPKDVAKMKEVLINSGQPGIWAVIGITDIAKEGNWAYDSNGQNINFNLTYMGQNKAKGTSNNCIIILTHHPHPAFGKILNIPCSTSLYQSICEL